VYDDGIQDIAGICSSVRLAYLPEIPFTSAMNSGNISSISNATTFRPLFHGRSALLCSPKPKHLRGLNASTQVPRLSILPHRRGATRLSRIQYAIPASGVVWGWPNDHLQGNGLGQPLVADNSLFTLGLGLVTREDLTALNPLPVGTRRLEMSNAG
jgi:hypothetical protein